MTITEENAKTKSEISALIYARKNDDFRKFKSLVEKLLNRYAESQCAIQNVSVSVADLCNHEFKNNRKGAEVCTKCGSIMENTYGTNKSWMLNDIIKEGHKPIAITVMICEETFVFESEDEIEPARKKYGNEGWWYSRKEFEKARKEYVNDYKINNWGEPPTVYWLSEWL